MSDGKNVAFILTMFQSYQWLHLKNQLLKKSRMDINEILEKEEDITNFQYHVDFEILMNTVHFAEVFAANLLALKSHNAGFHKYLLEYNIYEIINFYENAEYFDYNYLCKLLGYPEIEYCDKEKKDMLKKSCNKVKKSIIEIGEFYLKYRKLYNSYKHGFRIAIVEIGSDYETRRPIIMSPSNIDDLEQVTFYNYLDNNSLHISYIMNEILTSVYATFKERVIENKDSFKIKIWEE